MKHCEGVLFAVTVMAYLTLFSVYWGVKTGIALHGPIPERLKHVPDPRLCEVTTCSRAGEGSFRDCFSAEGPTMIAFADDFRKDCKRFFGREWRESMRKRHAATSEAR